MFSTWGLGVAHLVKAWPCGMQGDHKGTFLPLTSFRTVASWLISLTFLKQQLYCQQFKRAALFPYFYYLLQSLAWIDSYPRLLSRAHQANAWLQKSSLRTDPTYDAQ